MTCRDIWTDYRPFLDNNICVRIVDNNILLSFEAFLSTGFSIDLYKLALFLFSALQRKMEKSSTGIFSLSLKLYPGRYEVDLYLNL